MNISPGFRSRRVARCGGGRSTSTTYSHDSDGTVATGDETTEGTNRSDFGLPS